MRIEVINLEDGKVSNIRIPSILIFNRFVFKKFLKNSTISSKVLKKCYKQIKSFKEVKFTLEDYFMQFYREDKDFGGAMQWKKKKK